MKISVNWLKDYLDNPAPDGLDQLVERIGAQLGAVEEVVDIGQKYQKATIVKVVSCEDHPNADRLHVCKIDDGGVTKNIERDNDGHVQVVCGAPNVRAGMLAVWLPPGATVPESFDKEPFQLDSRPLRGVISNGMLASPRELMIGDSHEGLLEVDASTALPGMLFAEVYQLDDYIIDVENKMFTHRPDCFGQLGVAREIAGISGQSFYSPDWYLHINRDELIQDGANLPLEIRNELPVDVPRFMAVAMSGVKVRPSPLWLQSRLSRVGVRPINNVVDITNYMMLVTGQPLHAYDYDKVKAQDPHSQDVTLVVRYPQPGETLTLLNGKLLAPRSKAMMIASGSKLIGVGGVMGGADTEVDSQTTNIILECATFDMYSIRRTAMAHGLFTDAVTRNTKGQSPLQNEYVLAETVALFRAQASAQVASQVVDDNHLDERILGRSSLYAPVKVSTEFINQRLGLKLSPDQVATLLTNVEFTVQRDGADLIVGAPFWRTDIEIAEDVIEEVGRLYGFDHLPKHLPYRDGTPATKNPMLELKKQIRELLAGAGANEVLLYSFAHGQLLQKAGQDTAQAFQLANALSPDLQYFRLSLTPGLLDKVHLNIKTGHDEFALFELGKVHNQTVADQNEPTLPAESNRLGLMYANKSQSKGAAYYQVRRLLEFVLLKIHDCYAIVNWDELSADTQQALQGDNPQLLDYASLAAPYELLRSGFVVDQSDPSGLPIAIVGEFRSSVGKAFKLPPKTAGFELLLDHMAPPKRVKYAIASRYPQLEQDICLKVAQDLSYRVLFELVQSTVQKIAPADSIFTLKPIDIYQRDDDPAHKQITLRLKIASYDKTMTDGEVAQLLEEVAAAAQEQFQATRI